jgi:GABA(A) receptor-associated protein
MFCNQTSFKKKYSFAERQNESTKILNKYSDRIPIICEQKLNDNTPLIDKTKYLVPNDITIAQFLYVIRKRMKLSSEKALFICIGNCIPSSTLTVLSAYDQYQDEDGFLYVTYTSENTFGN